MKSFFIQSVTGVFYSNCIEFVLQCIMSLSNNTRFMKLNYGA